LPAENTDMCAPAFTVQGAGLRRGSPVASRDRDRKQRHCVAPLGLVHAMYPDRKLRFPAVSVTLQPAESEAAGVFILSFAATTVYCGRREAWKSQDVFAMSSGSGGFTAQDGPAAVSLHPARFHCGKKPKGILALAYVCGGAPCPLKQNAKASTSSGAWKEPSTE
jgi:hypothetical protein